MKFIYVDLYVMVYDRHKFLQECLESIVNQEFDFNGDNPNELDWHQDFMTSEKVDSDARRGIAIWAPLQDFNAERGSLEL